MSEMLEPQAGWVASYARQPVYLPTLTQLKRVL